MAIAEILRELCPDDSDATKLIGSMIERHDEWPGPQSLRNAAPEKRLYFK